jgi:NitT/TauT family transport system permease protein
MTRRLPLTARWLAPLLLLLLLGTAWQYAAANLRSIVPPLEAIWADLSDRPQFYLGHLSVTLHAALLGFLIGGGIAVVIAALAIHIPFVEAAVVPLAIAINVMPVVAIAPALIIAFGFTATPHIVIAALGSFFPLLMNAMTGFRAIDREAHDVFRVLAASRTDVFFRLRVPSAVPHLLAGSRLALTAAMISALVSEFTGTSKGLGAAIIAATTYLNLPQMWASIFVSMVASLVIVGLVSLAEWWWNRR